MTNNGIILMNLANELEQKRVELSSKEVLTHEETEQYVKLVNKIERIKAAIATKDSTIIEDTYNEIFHLTPKKAEKKEKVEIFDTKLLKKYYATPFDRALHLVRSYKHEDNYYNHGECTLTPEWVIANVFAHKCHYCGEDDWEKLGCDRIDNTKPHTPENCVPCCTRCNIKRGSIEYEKYMKIKKY